MLASLVLAFALVFVPGQQSDAVRQSEADFARGVELQKKGDYPAAQLAYEASLRPFPKRIDALSNLGVVLAHQGKYEEGIQRYIDALKVDPKQNSIRLNLGIAYFQTESFDLGALFPTIEGSCRAGLDRRSAQASNRIN